MKCVSAALRLACGMVLIVLPALKYQSFQRDIAEGHSVRLFNYSISSSGLVILLAVSAAVGLLLIILGIVSLRKKAD